MEVRLTPESQKQFERLPSSEKQKVGKKLTALSSELVIGKKLTGKFADLFSLKAWPYRIIYLVDFKRTRWVVSILHRQGAYK